MQEANAQTKGSALDRILELNEDCVRLCVELKHCLDRERAAVIQRKIEDLMETNATKAGLVKFLTVTKEETRALAKHFFGAEDLSQLEAKLDNEGAKRWRDSRARWLEIWDATRSTCLSNQRFLDHSLKQMNVLADHLKRQFGERGTYTARGYRADAMSPGKVVEARY